MDKIIEKKILVVLAHPDDETFGMGGTLALYARRGVKVYLVCATRGEVGEVDEDYLKGFNSIGERRESELRCAAGLLGLTEVYFMGYRDSGMPGSVDNQNPLALVMAPLDKVAEEVAHYIRQIQPQVVLTFDPIGGYRHPDHIHIQQATALAFDLAAKGPVFADDLAPFQAQRLYFHTMPRGFLRLITRVMPLFGKDPSKFGRNQDIDLKSIAEVDFPTHVRIDYRSVAKIRDEAAACHASQGGGFTNSGLVGWLRRQFAANETFMQAYPEPEKGKVKKDLFEGIN
jgi:LmbE family N-acetylglucosaminyl deacetylase